MSKICVFLRVSLEGLLNLVSKCSATLASVAAPPPERDRFRRSKLPATPYKGVRDGVRQGHFGGGEGVAATPTTLETAERAATGVWSATVGEGAVASAPLSALRDLILSVVFLVNGYFFHWSSPPKLPVLADSGLSKQIGQSLRLTLHPSPPRRPQNMVKFSGDSGGEIVALHWKWFWVCLSVCLSVFLSVCLSLSLFIICLCLSLSLFALLHFFSLSLSIYVSLHFSLSLSIHLSVCLSTCDPKHIKCPKSVSKQKGAQMCTRIRKDCPKNPYK